MRITPRKGTTRSNSAIIDQFYNTGRILTSSEHAPRIIKHLERNNAGLMEVKEYESGAVTIRRSLALTLDLNQGIR